MPSIAVPTLSMVTGNLELTRLGMALGTPVGSLVIASVGRSDGIVEEESDGIIVLLVEGAEVGRSVGAMPSFEVHPASGEKKAQLSFTRLEQSYEDNE